MQRTVHTPDGGRLTVARTLRLFGYDRPSHGESSPPTKRTVADTAADIRGICADMGIDRQATWGHPGGGPRLFLHLRHCRFTWWRPVPPAIPRDPHCFGNDAPSHLIDLHSALSSFPGTARPDRDWLSWCRAQVGPVRYS